MSKLREAAESAKLLLEQLNHIGDGLEYDGLDDESALGNVAGIIAMSPAYDLLRAALEDKSDQESVATIARIAFHGLGMAMICATEEASKAYVRTHISVLSEECKKLNLPTMNDLEISIIKKAMGRDA